MRPTRYLILGAWAPEIAPLRALARSLARRARGPHLLLDVTGVGLVDASVGSVAALEKAQLDGTKGDACLFVGTAGLHRDGRRPAGTARRLRENRATVPTLGRAVLARHLHLASAAVARQEGYWPGPLMRRLSSDEALRAAVLAAVPSLPSVDVATTLAITSKASLARSLGKALQDEGETGLPLVENLEAFAVARACQTRQVPFAAVLGLSNHVGPGAHEEWKELAKPASEQVSATVSAWLAGHLGGLRMKRSSGPRGKT